MAPERELIRGLHNLRSCHRGCVATIGSFDGVHLGHQAIIAQLNRRARELGLPSVAIIFEPQPHEYFSGERAPARLMRFKEKVLALFDAGVDRVLCLQFNEKLRSLSAQGFIQRILVDGLNIGHLVVGDDFRFGCDRSGDYHLLQRVGQQAGFSVEDTATVEIRGARVSSTRIRAALEAADFELAETLLGRPYRITGRVAPGRALGRQLGAPTANVRLQRYRSPLVGVYTVRVSATRGPQLVDGRKAVDGVANVGFRPTVEGAGAEPLLEVNLFDFDGDLYGRELAVEFCHKLRDEEKFASLEALKARIARDIAEAKTWFAQNP
ncbi:bifunctional riboflavin kinase/FAD synthetase [Microbulbifer thermotolerans]|uniref:Riboflavin biosynthesis protein n=1 Tax=Microbulbifer thermotolerans TaxID=252514 RepID=A0A143HIU1_MICTH|nr:bifunctional riboflavin kinase/FAD synthetase [Microbulbifer thermotolerans]AMX01635.1 bifunctional riboflavin kinase/FMN adenylyltransferase [Microbulbifer thermotolerans]MCX2780242.1 bifunctional riboflavin kinase/FAD synthetase [Microbulbifer thermotolerans]MCX2783866.1 bifunctional riboflavin kinase/FAD synthetase [Microbulbifer thermotolerans]MCX2795933.1 bifunctional riboflavin kinase/FAD synthetase [Microbulbifer thermotolerans]MCX2802614.1 bifunctional riboflavin kinase/FAD syntheta